MKIVKNKQYYVMKYNGDTWYNKNKIRIVSDKGDKDFLETQQYIYVAIISSPYPAAYLEDMFRNAI